MQMITILELKRNHMVGLFNHLLDLFIAILVCLRQNHNWFVTSCIRQNQFGGCTVVFPSCVMILNCLIIFLLVYRSHALLLLMLSSCWLCVVLTRCFECCIIVEMRFVVAAASTIFTAWCCCFHYLHRVVLHFVV